MDHRQGGELARDQAPGEVMGEVGEEGRRRRKEEEEEKKTAMSKKRAEAGIW